MQLKTHLAIAVFVGLFFLSNITHKFIFFIFLIAATALPDIDTAKSHVGQAWILRFLQFFTKHRGMIHSFTFMFLITLILIFIFPIAAFGFFLGYLIHLVSDAMTVDGIAFFWPSKKKIAGKITTGGLVERILFWIFVGLDVVILIFIVKNWAGA